MDVPLSRVDAAHFGSRYKTLARDVEEYLNMTQGLCKDRGLQALDAIAMARTVSGHVLLERSKMCSSKKSWSELTIQVDHGDDDHCDVSASVSVSVSVSPNR